MEPLYFLTIKEIQQRFAISRTHIHRLIKAKRFPAPLKLGRSSRWKSIDIEQWADSPETYVLEAKS